MQGRPRSSRPRAAVLVAKIPDERPGTAGGVRERNRREQTERIGEAALGLFLERGIEAVTIDAICGASGVAKGSFYRYFDDKGALVRALFAPVASAVEEAFSAGARSFRVVRDRESLERAYQSLALVLLPTMVTHADVLRLYLQERGASAGEARAPIRALAARIDAGAVELTRWAIAAGMIEVGDPRVSALAVVGAVEKLAHASLRGELDVPLPDLLSMLVRIVLDGVARRDGSRGARVARSARGPRT